ncbi:MAG: deoxyuridine 5'-triphosphate nucleotidohydrolase [Clostridia bacterium]|nr:deoxyuridine 5'-triphosphate nucleotidohydrolase [Clostridia bacterium]
MNAIARFARVSPEQYRRDAAAFQQVMPVEEIPLPRRATRGSAGYDFICPVEAEILPDQTVTIPTGLRAFIQPGWVLICCPRSSMGRKWGMRLANTIGVVDSDYVNADNEGHMLLMVVNGGDKPFVLHPGDRFCQGLFLPFGLAEEEEVTAERHGGYGSTGQ